MRQARVHMLPVYFQTLLNLHKKSPSLKMKLVDTDFAYFSLKNFVETGRAVEVGDYLILYDLGPTWYSPKLHLIEELTIRFQRVFNNPVSEAVAALSVLARNAGASAVGAGDTQVGLMTPYYIDAGYTVLGTQLFKEIDYGVPSEIDGGAGAD